MHRNRWITGICLLVLLAVHSAALAEVAPVAGTRTAHNVVIRDPYAYATVGDGIQIIEIRRQELVRTISAAAHDVSIADGLLFAVSGSGVLSVFSLQTPDDPQLIPHNESIQARTFTGVSAAGGIVVVSGGQSPSTVLTYDASGRLSRNNPASLGLQVVGRPDVLLAQVDTRLMAFISTDFDAGSFGITAVDLTDGTQRVVQFEGRGFGNTLTNAFFPANFPIESALLGTQLYTTNFNTNSIVVSDATGQSNGLRSIPVPFQPRSIAAMDQRLYVVGDRASVTVIDLGDSERQEQMPLPAAAQPSGVDVSADHIVVADRGLGVLVLDRP
ncbi:hypothetical protein [Candidatus Entotheonella palauensis]|uniref:hypothetical protein n=1 Tax=Candidatus Entotheonella palauensis TaxID=93172 RepID=UPI000B7FFBC1|nr:hypothetical protein [Candidatus Entotheonella palauensis]